MRGENNVKAGIGCAEQQSRQQGRAHPVNQWPLGVIAFKAFFSVPRLLQIIPKGFNSVPHQLKYIREKMRRMRVFCRIAVGMVLAVHNGIGTRV